MEIELTMKDKVVNKIIIQHDDLKFDGKTITIPSYYDSIIYDYLKYVDTKNMNDADKQDYLAFCKFFEDVITYKSDKVIN